MAPSWRELVGIALLCLLAGTSLLALQPQAPSVGDGVYTSQQATRGQTAYQARCASCHGPMLQGRSAPPLTGDDFLSNWETQPLLELANKVGKTMPKNDTPRLTAQESADILAYVLQMAKFPAGRAELVMDDAALKQVSFPTRAGQAKAAAATQQPSTGASGTVAQVMRGILFPSSNIIFTVQSFDPGAKKPEPAAAGDPAVGVDWLIWGGNVYQGWDVVDYAAISLAESATLMLTPGRKCENGKPVPVTDPDWIKFTNELVAAGRAAYKAAQTRNQEIVSDNTNQLNASCQHCHGVYRGRTHCVKP